jgi:tetratricopeptide (TPR) repeat protein
VQWRALKLLEEAEQMAGESAVLLHQRKELGEVLGLLPLVKSAEDRLKEKDRPPLTAWDHTALGRRLLQAGHLDEAAKEFAAAVSLDERGFWPHFYDGVCAYRRGKDRDSERGKDYYHEAVAAFRASAVAAAEAAPAAGAGALAARAHYNRGLAHAALGERDRAVEAYALARKHDPDLAEAALNHGLLLYDLGEPKRAAAELRHALAKGADPAMAHYGLACALLADGRPDEALTSVQKALLARPQFPEAQQLLRVVEGELKR